MFCQNCGSKNKQGAKFCSKCGTTLRTSQSQPVKVDKPVVSEVQPQAETKVKTNSELQNEVGTRSEKPHGPKWWMWAVPLILVVAIGGGFFIYKNNQSTTQPLSSSVADKSSSSSSYSAPSKASKKSTIDFPKSTIQGTIDDAFGDMKGETSVYVSPTDSTEEVVSNSKAQRAASNIKLFILITAYQQVNEVKLNLNDKYTLKDSDKVDGTGEIRNMSSGSEISMQDLLEDMMEDSDNTAANIVIRQLGGMDKVNAQIKKIGAKDTKLERMLMDTDALKDGKDNYTSVADLGMVLKKIYNHQMVSTKYDNAMLDILKKNNNHTKLPHDLPEEATVYNKTGEFDDYGVENDAAIFGNNKGSFVIVVMSQDGSRDEQIKKMNSFGSVMYDGLLG
ncbi:serine hydrolase [Pediococcus pentosaceus]|jgi:beta-lactamase class A|uniref:Serine hydrolase n=1 Tax=Pediococcus pentosaceus TaxID=1255 RepID=A0A6L5A1M3_PEDPE|nr:serine hydrolase [Pediococcus pentosaceus]KAF0351551.1 zinc-ribbon domain-containing protein [Pediococcus pentosaceus]KAF0413907.1 zinc-ribbon domain-containing protein [Pediococcus pentosaceus]KAF0503316.1 zinc-ribbon domain-containing protein [Pediococcus pentosaceus]MBF7106230.1 serine hydrolase [Pediococcus pentosaceus]MBF7108961.1 serine hydrolase [Pediococcus pentosaceus]